MDWQRGKTVRGSQPEWVRYCASAHRISQRNRRVKITNRRTPGIAE